MKGPELLGLSLRLVGALFGVAAVAVGIATIVFLQRAVAVGGRVVDHEVVQNAITFLNDDDQTGMLYYPVVRVTDGGNIFQFTARRGGSNQMELGRSVTVLYRHGRPESARIQSILGVWGASIVLGGLALLFVLLSFLVPYGFGGATRSRSLQ